MVIATIFPSVPLPNHVENFHLINKGNSSTVTLLGAKISATLFHIFVDYLYTNFKLLVTGYVSVPKKLKFIKDCTRHGGFECKNV